MIEYRIPAVTAPGVTRLVPIHAAINLTDDELLLWSAGCFRGNVRTSHDAAHPGTAGRTEGWVILYGSSPDATRLRLQRFDRTADAAERFWDLCFNETPYVRVVRVTDGEARFVGHAFKGRGAMSTVRPAA